MANVNEIVGPDAEDLDPDTEINMLIAAIAARQAKPQGALSSRLRGGDMAHLRQHPADAFLQTLNTKVETEARDQAKLEIDGIADEIKHSVEQKTASKRDRGGFGARRPGPSAAKAPPATKGADLTMLGLAAQKRAELKAVKDKQAARLDTGLKPVSANGWLVDVMTAAKAAGGGAVFFEDGPGKKAGLPPKASEDAGDKAVLAGPNRGANPDHAAARDRKRPEALLLKEPIAAKLQDKATPETRHPAEPASPIVTTREVKPKPVPPTEAKRPVRPIPIAKPAPVIDGKLRREGAGSRPSRSSPPRAMPAPVAALSGGTRKRKAAPKPFVQPHRQPFDRRELPLWFTLGMPLAAVSMAALLVGIAALGDDPASENLVLASTGAGDRDPAADRVEPVQSVLPSVPETAETNAKLDAAPAKEAASQPIDANTSAETPSTAPVPVSAAIREPVSRSTQGSASLASVAIVPPPSVKPIRLGDATIRPPAASPSRATQLASISPTAPSAKPRTIAVRAGSGRQVAAVQTQPPLASQRQTTNTLPVRVFSGAFEDGSAAAVIAGLADLSGSGLTDTETRWLARDLERALDNEIDGRKVSLKSARGDRYLVSFDRSQQEVRTYDVSRSRDVAALPDQIVLEGGWYVAQSTAPLRATPSASGFFQSQTLETGMLVQRMGTFTDRYGDRWYLVGQRGVAIGYVSPADVVVAGAYAGDFGLPFAANTRDIATDRRTVFTPCRMIRIETSTGAAQRVKVCRDASGHWIDARTGLVETQQARSGRPVEAATLLVAAAETSSRNELPDAIKSQHIQDSLDQLLDHAGAGQSVKRPLIDGNHLTFTFGDVYHRDAFAPIMRVDALGPIDRPLRIKAGWMQVPNGASLHPTPSYESALSVRKIEPGFAIETIGDVTDDVGRSWTLVGRSGTAFGYVPSDALAELSGTEPVRAMPNIREQRQANWVATSVPCRTVAYDTGSDSGSLTACQDTHGGWELTPDTAVQRYAQGLETQPTAP
ncbi:MAG: hypothetical protein AAGK23_11565 [Pseudomonadota bacterium]